MSATHTVHSTTKAAPVLYVAFELGWTTWKMAFTIGAGQPPRIRTIPARLTTFVMSGIKKAKLRFGLPANTPVVAFYEAGRDGFWLHRFLMHEGIRFSAPFRSPRTLTTTSTDIPRNESTVRRCLLFHCPAQPSRRSSSY